MAAACITEPLPVRERVSHPWALTLTAPDAAALAVDLPRVRAAHPNRPLRWMTASEDVDTQLAALGFRTVRVTTGGEIVLAEVDRAPFRAARDALTASELAVMDAVLRAADVAGATRLYAEFDSTDPQALAMLEMFTLEDAEVWRTYQTAVPDGTAP